MNLAKQWFSSPLSSVYMSEITKVAVFHHVTSQADFPEKSIVTFEGEGFEFRGTSSVLGRLNQMQMWSVGKMLG